MKKVLFATTALIATAGIASAQGVTLSGSAEMGVFGGDRFEEPGPTGSDSDLQFHTDVDVTFTLSGTTDAGLVFGTSVDLDESTIADTAAGGSVNGAFGDDSDDGGVSIFISGDLGTLTLGDTDGALDWALREAAIGGSIADDHTFHAGYNGNGGLDGKFDGQIARYEYTFGDFSVAGSVEMDETNAELDTVYGVGGRYSGDFGQFSVGLGLAYQTGDDSTGEDRDAYGFSADVEFSDFQVIFNYSDLDGIDGFDEHYAIAVGYTLDALTVGFNYGQFELDDGVAGDDPDGYGLAVDYDLGGGAELQFGYGDSSPATGDDVDSYSFGLSLSF